MLENNNVYKSIILREYMAIINAIERLDGLYKQVTSVQADSFTRMMVWREVNRILPQVESPELRKEYYRKFRPYRSNGIYITRDPEEIANMFEEKNLEGIFGKKINIVSID
jgi:hypothetical protein